MMNIERQTTIFIFSSSQCDNFMLLWSGYKMIGVIIIENLCLWG